MSGPAIMLQNRRFLLIRRPSGLPVAEDFELVTEVVAPLSEGQFLVSNQYASLDPAIRGWMDDAPSYLPPIKLGDPVRAPTIGTVIQSRHADFPVGKWISGMIMNVGYLMAAFTEKKQALHDILASCLVVMK